MIFCIKFQPLYSALIIHLLFFLPSEGTPNPIGHTTDLIPIDSPLSPFYNPSNTHFDRLRNAFQRSLKRINHFNSVLVPNNAKTLASMTTGGGEYLIKYSLGTPPIDVIGIVDTGSDLIWTQCLPCIECYNQTIPFFDPTHSSSYNTISCQSNFCEDQCVQNSRICEYSYSYGDGSYTSGNLVSETLILGTRNPISLPNIAIGCAHDTAGIFDSSASGIIGLGGGNLSLISQMGAQLPASKKFSYCLTPLTNKNSKSKISFGKDSVVSGPGVVTLPTVKKDPQTFYYVTLEAFSVGPVRIAFARNVEGNMIIDSGTALTLLAKDVYTGLEAALDNVIRGKRVRDPNDMFSLCYQSVPSKIRLPIITAHFKGGDVKLKQVNTFSWVKEDVICFTMTSNSFNVFGNLAQTNFLIGYDLEAGTVSFKPTDCSKEH